MASAEKIEKVVEVIQDEKIVLTLSPSEAEIVRSLVGGVNIYKGDVPEKEIRSIYNALSDHLGGFCKYRAKEIYGASIVMVNISSKGDW